MRPQHDPWVHHDYAGPLSVQEMAAVIGLSRTQFNEHVRRGVLPPPVYDLVTHRPYYTVEQQRVVIGVRGSRIGINGRYVLFYSRRQQSPPGWKPKPKQAMERPKSSAASPSFIDDLHRAMGELGLTSLTKTDVEHAVAIAFPGGVPGDLQRAVQPTFLELRRRGVR